MQAGSVVPPIAIRDSICVVDGFGIRIEVKRGHLAVSDGTGRDRHRSTLARATTKMRHLIVVGHSGSVTLEAMRWLAELGIDYVHLSPDGRILATSGALGLDDPRLRRAQALATGNELGLAITRLLLAEKMSGQKRNLELVPGSDEAAAKIEETLSRLEHLGTLEAMRAVEAEAAVSYWRSLEDVPVLFARKDEAKVPEHWLRFGTRGSPLTNSPRRAANPANAILNYLYAILEAQTRIACMKVGLDPGLGILHADQPARYSMALDLMEVVRPDADAELLRLLAGQVFRASDFRETRQGDCRVLAPLTRQLSRYAAFFAGRVGPVAEGVAQALAGNRRMPTHLSQASRSKGREGVRKRSRRPTSMTGPPPVSACPRCGVVLDQGRTYCDDCLPERRDEILVSFSAAGPAALAAMRAEGRDPTTTQSAREKLGRAIGANIRAAAEWDSKRDLCPDPEVFRLEILPGLQSVPLAAIMWATGLSKRHSSRIRRGYVPHPRHWEALRLVAVEPAQDSVE